MRYGPSIRLSLVLAVAAALSASPALAQGKAKGHDKERDRPTLVKRDSEARRKEMERESRLREQRLKEEYGRRDGRSQSRQVPPGWCQGKGNPHNTVANCGYSGSRDRYDSRSSGYDRSGTYGRDGSYDQAHADFHRELDRKYDRLGSERPFDVRYQLQLRQQKQAEHDRWHAQAGIGHDGSRRY